MHFSNKLLIFVPVFIDKGKKRCYNMFCLTKKSFGRVAQLGEHWLYKPGVTGSSPVPPTNYYQVLGI